MGENPHQNRANQRLWNLVHLTMVTLCWTPVYCQQCQIQLCNADYDASSPPSSGMQEEVQTDVEHCIALRAYSQCIRRTERSCRGDLAYHSAVYRVKDLFGLNNCSLEGPTASGRVPSAPHPSEVEPCDHGGRARASGQPERYAHCALFGDPHLRTFRDEFQTCRVGGAWPLIDNQYLSVQVTNVPVVTGSGATATTKITVIFKTFRGCSEQKVYQATTDDLPSAFLDGSRSGEEKGGPAVSGKGGAGASLVRIHARYIGSSVIIRRLGRYLTFAIRVPEDLLELPGDSGGLQLCLHGCPRGELIAEPALPSSPPRRHGYSAEQAAARCREALGVEDAYFQSCVFDLLTTGDPAFASAAFFALQDLKALAPGKGRPNPVGTAQSSSAGTHGEASLSSLLALLVLAVCLKDARGAI